MNGSMNQSLRAMSLVASVAILLSLSLGAFANAKPASQDIVDTAVSAGSFKTLVSALQAAGLVDTLKGNGPLRSLLPQTRRSQSCLPERSKICSSRRIRKSLWPS